MKVQGGRNGDGCEVEPRGVRMLSGSLGLPVTTCTGSHHPVYSKTATLRALQ